MLLIIDFNLFNRSVVAALVWLDVADKQTRVHPRAVDIGIGAETAIKVFWK